MNKKHLYWNKKCLRPFLIGWMLFIGILFPYYGVCAQEKEMEIHDFEEISDQFAPSEKLNEEENASQMACRLVVFADLSEDYGASKVYHFTECQETILEFEKESQAKAVYLRLKNLYDCFLDAYLSADEILASCHSWGTESMELDKMQSTGRENNLSSGLTVAVLDTGIDVNHEIFLNKVDLEKSYNFAEGNNNISDIHSEGHGTHVSGILADSMPEGAKIIACKIFNEQGASSRLIVHTAFQYAIEQGADVVNFSASWEDESGEGFLDGIFDQAYNAGIPIVVAAGNDGADVATCYPANLSQAVTVGSLAEFSDNQALLADYSNKGRQIDFVAPGSEIESARAGFINRYKTMSGTSMAVPHIVSDILFIKNIYPDISISNLLQIMKENSCDLGEEGWDQDFGWGIPLLNPWYDKQMKDGKGHSYEKQITKATCTEDGVVRYICQKANCGQTFSKTIEATGHVWKSQVETLEENTQVRFTCAICGTEMVYPTSGTCGDSMVWKSTWSYSYSYDEMVCHLEIRGSGEMKEFGEGNFPWTPFVGKIKSITMDYGVRSIADYAFKGTEDLLSSGLSLSSNLEKIGKEAFADGMRLSSFTLGSKVRILGDGAFSGCRNLGSLQVKENNAFFISDGTCIYDHEGKILYACITKGLEEPVLKEGLSQIQSEAFRKNQNIKTICLPSSVTEIGQAAFAKCYGLNRIEFLSESMEILGNETFLGVEAQAVYHVSNETWKKLIADSYGGNLSWSYEGIRQNIDQAEIILEKESYPYMEKEICPSAVVTFEGERLVENVDYTLSYEENDKPGTAKVKIAGIGYWQGEGETSFQIEKGKAELFLDPTCLSDGKFTIGLGTLTDSPVLARIAVGETYENAGHAQILYASTDSTVVTVDSRGRLTGASVGETVVKAYLENDPYYEDAWIEIPVKVDQGFDRVILDQTLYYYTGQAIEPKPQVYSNDQLLTEHEDYELSYKDSMEAGVATLRVQGKGNYRGYLEQNYIIRKQVYNMSGITFRNDTFTYDGQEHRLDIQGNLPEGVTVTYRNNDESEVGTYVVTAYFQGDIYHESIASLKATMTIEPLDLSEKNASLQFARWDNVDQVEYTGEDICPTVVVDGLKEGDYTVQYQDNEEPGQATVIVKGTGNYCGQIVLSFTIHENDLWRKEQGETDPDEEDDPQNPEDDDNEEDDDQDDSASDGNIPDSSGVQEQVLQGILISSLSRKVAVGKKMALQVTPYPSNITLPQLLYVSSNTKLATVSQSGVVTMKKKAAGKKVRITVISSENPSIRASVVLQGMKSAVKKLELLQGKKKVSGKTITLAAGKSLKLKAKVTSGKGANKTLYWTSSNSEWLTVKNGIINTKAAGRGKKVTVKAMATDGSGKRAIVTIIIK